MMRRAREIIMIVENKLDRSVKGMKRPFHNPVSSIKPYQTILTSLLLNYKSTPVTNKIQ